MAFLREPLNKRENWTIKGNARRYRESFQSFSCWFAEKLSKNQVLVSRSPPCYLTMEHSTEFFSRWIHFGKYSKKHFQRSISQDWMTQKKERQKLPLFHVAWTLASRKPPYNRFLGVGEMEFHKEWAVLQHDIRARISRGETCSKKHHVSFPRIRRAIQSLQKLVLDTGVERERQTAHGVSGRDGVKEFAYIQQLMLFRTFSSEPLMAHMEPMMKKANIFLQLKI